VTLPTDFADPTLSAKNYFTAADINATNTKVNALDAAVSALGATDADLTDIGALTPANDDVLQRKAGHWANRTPSQVKADLALSKTDVGLGSVDNTADTAKPVSTATQTALNGKQPLDADLTTIAGLTATTDNVIQSAGGAWASRTPAQLKTTLALTKSDVGLGFVDNTADTAKPVSTAQQTALDAKVDESMLTTKGDLFVATAAGTITRLPVGADGQVLTADPAQTPGVKWATPAGGGGGGSGDVVGPSASVASEVALFDGTTGKLVKRATGTGIAKLTSGVLGTATAGTDYYNPGGTDVAVADGGTGASTAAAALSNLKAVAGSVNGTATTLTLWTGTQAQYDAIGTKDTATVYVIT
jgi:hypothetical protein